MSQDELYLASHKMLISIHVITGWTLPEGNFLDALESNFEKKLLESYSNLNVEEIEYAFRNRDAAIKDWGKALNFSLIDEVILPYLEKRFELSKLEEQEKNKTLAIEQPVQEITHLEMIEWIDQWKKQDQINLLLIPISFYYFLLQTETIKIDTPTKKDFFTRAISSIKAELNEATTLAKNQDALKTLAAFTKMETEGFDAVTKDRIANRAKKIIVYDYLTKKTDV